jgi:hypothetical protein
LSRKVKYLSHLANQKGRSLAIVLSTVCAKQRRVFRRRTPKLWGWFSGGETLMQADLDFDTVDRCFAKLAAAGFVGFVAVVAWMWLS